MRYALLSLLFFPAISWATLIQFDQSGPATGSLTYDGAGGALFGSGISFNEVTGTGTPLNDIAEGHAIQRWAGSDVGKVAVSSTKSCIGHLLGGAGAVEAVITLMALREGWLPPSMNIRTPDPVCTFDLVREPRDSRIRHALTNSFGFGGANATVILSDPDAAAA